VAAVSDIVSEGLEVAPGAATETAGPAARGIDHAQLMALLDGVDPGTGPASEPYARLAARALDGEAPDRETARALLRARGGELGNALAAAFAVRSRHFGRRVKVCILENARSGLCPEDCHYCSQSAVSTADIERYPLRSAARLIAAARRAEAAGARRFCMVVSARGPSDRDIDRFATVARAVRDACSLEICVSAGLMNLEQAQRLREAGVGWVNHNINTSRRFYPEICGTHTYDDRLETLRNVRAAGLATCSGVIMGMGETDDDLIDAAEALRGMTVDSLPVNFLHPIDGTPLESQATPTAERALAGLCLFRLYNPASDIRAAGGRERTLGAYQPLALYAATSIFADGYLTTPGQAAHGAHAMVTAMGFAVEA
jgi:biotin synthase